MTLDGKSSLEVGWGVPFAPENTSPARTNSSFRRKLQRRLNECRHRKTKATEPTSSSSEDFRIRGLNSHDKFVPLPPSNLELGLCFPARLYYCWNSDKRFPSNSAKLYILPTECKTRGQSSNKQMRRTHRHNDARLWSEIAFGMN